MKTENIRMPAQVPGKHQRLIHLEVLRIVAAYFVIFNHTGARGFFLFSQRPMDSAAFWVYMIPSVLCRLAVPLFLCISGALMLHREQEPLKTIWQKRIGKIVCALVIFVAANHVWDFLACGKALDLRQLVLSLYTGFLNGEAWWYGHLWYLYAYLAFLMCLPFLRSMVSGMENRHFWYLIALTVFFGNLLPVAEYLLAGERHRLYSELVPSWTMAKCFLYPCVGYFLEHRIGDDQRKRILPWCWAASLLGTALTCWLVRCEGATIGIFEENTTQKFHDFFVLLNCMALYLTAKELFARLRMSRWIEAAILSVGKCTFGIYLIHIMVLNSRSMTALLTCMTGAGINNLAAVLLQCLAVFVVSFGIVRLLMMVPGVRKLLGG